MHVGLYIGVGLDPITVDFPTMLSMKHGAMRYNGYGKNTTGSASGGFFTAFIAGMEIDRVFRDKLADALTLFASIFCGIYETQHSTTFRRIFDNAGAPRMAEE